MPKLKWKFLIPDQYMSIYDEHGMRIMVSIAVSATFWLVGAAATFAGGPLALGIPMLAIALGINGWGVFGYLLPRLHWLYGLEDETKSALEWYDELTKLERAQLPRDWDVVVRKNGQEPYNEDATKNRWRIRKVAEVMQERGRAVVSAHNDFLKSTSYSVQDYRVPVQMQLMQSALRKSRPVLVSVVKKTDRLRG